MDYKHESSSFVYYYSYLFMNWNKKLKNFLPESEPNIDADNIHPKKRYQEEK